MATDAEVETEALPWWTRAFVVWPTVIAAVVTGIVVTQVQEAREDAERVDGYYCTLSGISPSDRAPETGRLCADILAD